MSTDIIEILRAQGWTMRFTASGKRLHAAVENYRSSNYVVQTIPIRELIGNDSLAGCEIEHDPPMLIFTKPAIVPEMDNPTKAADHPH